MASIVSALGLERERQLFKLLSDPVRLHLLYQGSHHGFDINTLTSKFDEQGRFVVMAYLKPDLVRGVYLSKAPKQNKNEDQEAFIFEINGTRATRFDVRKGSDAVSYTESRLSFGQSLTFYGVFLLRRPFTMTLQINMGSDLTYTSTRWLNKENVPYIDVELHRVQDPGDVLLNPWRKVPWTENNREALRGNLLSFKPVCQSLNQVRVLLLGPTGSGKSSFINSIRSVLYGRVTHMPIIGSSPESFTKKLKSYNIRLERGGKPTALTLCDVLALGEADWETGLTHQDALAVMKGHAPEGHTFQWQKKFGTTVDAQCPGFRPEPSFNDKIHCAAIVLDASKVTTYTENLQVRLRELHAEISDLDIPQVILLTNVDQVCHAVQEDVKFVYTSCIAQEKMQKAAEVVGLPLSCVLPIKNYSGEHSVSCNTDILLLSAVDHILQAVDEYLDDYYPPAPTDASAGPQAPIGSPVTV